MVQPSDTDSPGHDDFCPGLFLGSLVRLVLDKNTTVKEQTIADEGEVIEKTGQEEQEETTEDKTVS